jgi:hypothetical protein
MFVAKVAPFQIVLGVCLVATASASPSNQLPSIERLTADLKGVNSRDAAARLTVATNLLWDAAKRAGDRGKAEEYLRVAHATSASRDNGTPEGFLYRRCKLGYQYSKAFTAALFDLYFSRDWQQAYMPKGPPSLSGENSIVRRDDSAPARPFPQGDDVCTADASKPAPPLWGGQQRSLLLDRLPSVDAIAKDMRGITERDTAARVAAALQWLGIIAERLNGGRSKGSAYVAALGEFVKEHPLLCKDEPGCNPQVTGRDSRFSWCRNGYVKSVPFLREVLDKYVSGEHHDEIRKVAGMGVRDLLAALALEKGGVAPLPTEACTTPDQFTPILAEGAVGPGSVFGNKQRQESRLRHLQEARATFKADSPIKQRALAVARQASGRTDLTVFGLPLGAELTLPDCDNVGRWEKGVLDTVSMVSPETCIRFDSDGSVEVHWGTRALPEWAPRVHVTLAGNVAVAAKLLVPSGAIPPGEVVGEGVVAATLAANTNAASARAYHAALKHGREMRAKARKALRDKYGPAQDKAEALWVRPGLRVKYEEGDPIDTIVIELPLRSGTEAVEPSL